MNPNLAALYEKIDTYEEALQEIFLLVGEEAGLAVEIARTALTEAANGKEEA